MAGAGAGSRDGPSDGPPAPRGGLLDRPRCRSLCTARGCCRLLQSLLCLLLIGCSSVSYSSAGGYTGLFSLGGAHYYHYGGAYSGLSGPDGERARRLDAQFHQLQRPPAQGAMAVGGGLLAVSCLALGAGLARLPRRCPAWLLAEALLDAAAALGLGPGLYFYYRHLGSTYASAVCQERERLYRSKGYAGFGCSVHGAEIAAGLFAGLAAVAYSASAALAVRAFCTLRKRRAKAVELHQLQPGPLGSASAPAPAAATRSCARKTPCHLQPERCAPRAPCLGSNTPPPAPTVVAEMTFLPALLV